MKTSNLEAGLPATTDSTCPGCGVTFGGRPKQIKNPPCSGCLVEMLQEMWEWFSKRHRLLGKCDSCGMRLTADEHTIQDDGTCVCPWCGGPVNRG